MAILMYLLALAITAILFILGLFMVTFGKKKTFKIIGTILILPALYFLISTLNFIGEKMSTNKNSLLSGEADFLMGTDYIELYDDNTFDIQYVDHIYHGNYESSNDTIYLDFNINIFTPFRHNIDNVLIIEENSIHSIDDNFGMEVYYNILTHEY